MGQGIVRRVRGFPVQTLLGTWLGIETQSCYKASSDLQVETRIRQRLPLGE